MKKLITLFILFISTLSCSVENESNTIYYETLPVESVIIPDVFYLGDSSPIEITYKRPSTCHGFDGFYYEKDDFTRTIAIRNYVVQNTECTGLNNVLKTEVLNFSGTTVGTHIFKFWTGKDTNGNDTFLTFEREVVIN